MVEHIKTAASGRIGQDIQRVQAGEIEDVDHQVQHTLLLAIIAERLGILIDQSKRSALLS